MGFALFLTVTTCLGAGGCAAGGWTDGHRQGRVQRNHGEKDSKEKMRLQRAHEWHGAIRCGIKTWEYDMAGTAEAAGQLRGEAAGVQNTLCTVESGDREVTREPATGQSLSWRKALQFRLFKQFFAEKTPE